MAKHRIVVEVETRVDDIEVVADALISCIRHTRADLDKRGDVRTGKEDAVREGRWSADVVTTAGDHIRYKL